jgi:acetyl-CoA synthetase
MDDGAESRFRAVRDVVEQIHATHGVPSALHAGFRWPRLDHFNFVGDYFDRLAAGTDRVALRIVGSDGRVDERTYADLAAESARLAAGLAQAGAAAGQRMLVMLGNVLPLWQVMLAAMRLEMPLLPATTLLSDADLADRIARGRARWLVVDSAAARRIGRPPVGTRGVVVDGPVEGWVDLARLFAAEPYRASRPTPAETPLLLYFTSGTTSQPKLVVHTHVSYPIGHLSSLCWIGIRPDDVHLNISSPGWGKHAWSSFFVPWLAGATILVHRTERFRAAATLDVLSTQDVTSFCAPPTVWRALVQEDLRARPMKLRSLMSGGEPLNPEIVDIVREAWGVEIREGYGQTETTGLVGVVPGDPVRKGAMGRALPGYRIALLDGDDAELNGEGEGEIAVSTRESPVGLMVGYEGDPERTAASFRGGYFRTGDVARRDGDGYYHFVGRTDDVFKSSDYRLSPFELESAMLLHPAVAEVAVVPSPDPARLAVPKAFVVLAQGWSPDARTADALFEHSRSVLSPFKRIRRLEFGALPMTVSGKIRRSELRTREAARSEAPAGEFAEPDAQQRVVKDA